MGCDIHLVIEYSDFKHPDGTPYWSAFGGRINPGRDYHMFEVMAGVRGEDDQIFAQRGMPEGRVSYQTEDMVEPYNDDETERVPDSDLHSHSWLSADEFAQCYANRMLISEYGPPGVAWEMVWVVLNGFKNHGMEARIVFAFDN